MQRKHCIIVLVCILCIAVLLCFLLWPNKSASSASPSLRKAAEGLNDYQVTMKLDPVQNTLSVSEEIHFTNRTGQTLSSIQLRLWPNAYERQETSPAAIDELFDACYFNGFNPGYVKLHDVKWNGETAAHSFTDDASTTLSVSVPELADGEAGTLFIRCVVQLGNCAHRTGYMNNTFMLGQVMPTLSVFENGAWRQDAYSPIGDPFYTECANYTLMLYVPEGYTPACSLPLVQEKSGAWTGSGLAMRDLGLCISADFETASASLNGIRILSYAEDQKSAAQAAQYAKKALSTYQALYGAYPYPTFTVCCAPFAPGAMEYTAMAVIDDGYFAKDQWDTLELFIAHEAAHQWFYAMVGSDQVNNPWQDEALCEYALLRYVEKNYGQSAYENLRFFRVDSPMQERIPGGLTPGSPIDYFSTLADYKSIVYGRGAALLISLDTFLPGGVDAFLKHYAQEYAFRIASRTDFENALNAWAGQDLLPLVRDYLDTKMME